MQRLPRTGSQHGEGLPTLRPWTGKGAWWPGTQRQQSHLFQVLATSSPGHLGPMQAPLPQLPEPEASTETVARSSTAHPPARSFSASASTKACPPPPSGVSRGPSCQELLLPALLRVGKGLISMQKRKPPLRKHHVRSGGTGGGAAPAVWGQLQRAEGWPRGAASGLTGVEVRAEGEAGVEEGRRHGQGQQRGGHPRADAALRTPGAPARAAPSPERPPQVRGAPCPPAGRAPTAAAAEIGRAHV